MVCQKGRSAHTAGSPSKYGWIKGSVHDCGWLAKERTSASGGGVRMSRSSSGRLSGGICHWEKRIAMALGGVSAGLGAGGGVSDGESTSGGSITTMAQPETIMASAPTALIQCLIFLSPARV